jgi:hypothetical protein
MTRQIREVRTAPRACDLHCRDFVGDRTRQRQPVARNAARRIEHAHGFCGDRMSEQPP